MDSAVLPSNRERNMATIKINDITLRQACIDGADPDAGDVYDANVERILGLIAEKAKAFGHTMTVLPNSTGAATYRVETDDERDAESAHDFMQSDAADFWRYL